MPIPPSLTSCAPPKASLTTILPPANGLNGATTSTSIHDGTGTGKDVIGFLGCFANTALFVKLLFFERLAGRSKDSGLRKATVPRFQGFRSADTLSQCTTGTFRLSCIHLDGRCFASEEFPNLPDRGGN